tara:strand:- start:1839 stop:2198 length:360 start_codon:yes stop_codon:yes gene_type:complete
MVIDQLTTPNNSLPKPLSTSTPTNSQAPHVTVVPTDQSKHNSITILEGQIEQAVNKIQQFTDKLAQNLLFSIDKDTGITVVKVMDTNTQEVIRQFPTEEAISIARTLDKVQGLLFDGKA